MKGERRSEMFKNLKLSTKLWGLTALLLIAVLIVAANSIWSFRSLISNNDQYSDAARSKGFLSEKEADHLRWIGKVQALFVENEPKLDAELDHTKCGLGKFLYGEEGERMARSNPEIASLITELKEPHKRLHDSGQLIGDVWHQRHKGLRHMLRDRLDDHRRWAATVSQMVINRNPDINLELDPNLCAFGKFLSSQQYADYAKDFPALRNAIEAVKEPHRLLHLSAKEIKEQQKAGDYEAAAKTYESSTLPQLASVEKEFLKAIKAEGQLEEDQKKAGEIFQTKTLPALHATQEKMGALKNLLTEIEDSANQEMKASGSRSQWTASLFTAVAFILGVLISVFLIRSITRPINRLIRGLNEGADQVASAAGQVSSASQSLAEGASEQAASLEETSSSLEEMSSMTKQNADNAGQADNLMKEANHIVGGANQSMAELTASMQEISSASEETSKIIKTIDEIAFQTNLLALNAAVEAARAGEAGAGFAVVADEVRNLAMRAAEAAKNTANLIEGTVNKVKGGSQLVTRANEGFSEVAKSAAKVGELVAEIAAASSEQAEGIDQVNKAVAEMDKVVQQNAANAEESASASEEMNAQAAQMKSMVQELVALVGGRNKVRNAGPDPQLSIGNEGHDRLWQADSTETSNSNRRAIAPHSKEMRADQVIPLDDKDFRNF
jgi:methyl-accepting chemotaxis protein